MIDPSSMGLLGTSSPYLAAFAVLCFLYYVSLPRPLPGIPYNEAASKRLLGDIPDVKRAKYRRPWVRNQPRSHGSALSQIFVTPFSRQSATVIVSDYREVWDICTSASKRFDRSDLNKKIVGLVAPEFHFTMKTSDPRFKSHRELLRDLMSPAFLNQVAAPQVYERATLILSLWDLKMKKGQSRPFSAGRDLYHLTLDIICAVSFGMEYTKAALRQEMSCTEAFQPSAAWATNEAAEFPEAQMSAEIEALLDMAPMMAIGQKSPFPRTAQVMAAVFNPRHARAFWHRRSLIEKQTTKGLDRLVAGGEGRRESALDHLLLRELHAARMEDRKPNFYCPAIRDETLGFLLAGHETSATVLSWWVKYMSRYQSVQHRLRKELEEAYPAAHQDGRLPTMTEMTKASIPYLDAVIEETLRYAGVVNLIARTATCDTEILGCKIPKGTDLLLVLTGPSIQEPAVQVKEALRSKSATHPESMGQRVPPWGDDVGEFKPERWLKQKHDEASGRDEEVFDRLAGPTLAMSAGPRMCYGYKLAYLQLRTVMTLLIWEFRFGELPDALNGDELVEGFVNGPRDCYVALTKA